MTSLITFHAEMIGRIDKGRTVDTVCLNFSTVFDAGSHKILIDKLMKYEMDEQTMS